MNYFWNSMRDGSKGTFFIIVGFILFLNTHLGYLLRIEGQSEHFIYFQYCSSLLIFYSLFAFKYFVKLKEIFFHFTFPSQEPQKTSKYLIPISLILLTLISRLIFLKSYPYVSVWDPVRDGGIMAQEVSLGLNNDLFGNGPYNGWGRMMLGLTSHFYQIFGPSVYTYRVPGAIISILNILIFSIFVFVVTRKKSLSAMATLILICNTQHIYFSREELLVLFNSFFCTLILLHLYLAMKWGQKKDAALLGLILGCAFNFHVPLWSVILLSYLVFFIVQIQRRLKNQITVKEGYQQVLLFLALSLVGLGPRIYNLNRDVLGQHNGFAYKVPLVKIFFNQKQHGQLNDYSRFTQELHHFRYKDIWENYKKSLMVYFYENAKEHTKDESPLLPFLFGVFFFLGLYHMLLCSQEKFYKVLVAFALIIPLTNSAITDLINFDHRIFVLVPLVAFISSLGVEQLRSHFTKQSQVNLVYTCAVLLIFIPALDFFINARSHKKYKLYDFMSMHGVYLIQEQLKKNIDDKGVCLRVGFSYFDHMRMPHMDDHLKYFLYPFRYRVYLDVGLADNILQITRECEGPWEKERSVEVCKSYDQWLCPQDFPNQSMVIEIDRQLSSSKSSMRKGLSKSTDSHSLFEQAISSWD